VNIWREKKGCEKKEGREMGRNVCYLGEGCGDKNIQLHMYIYHGILSIIEGNIWSTLVPILAEI
jgi:hypothetical protein